MPRNKFDDLEPKDHFSVFIVVNDFLVATGIIFQASSGLIIKLWGVSRFLDFALNIGQNEIKH